MSRFTIHETPILHLKVLERRIMGDSRGFLTRLFCFEELKEVGWKKPVMQINHTMTQKVGTIRGMHFQLPPNGEIKLVTCLRGAIWDVAVDLRSDSPTFLQWYATELSASNHRALLIPEGFAHGFQALSEESEILYLHSSIYAPELESGINPIDPMLSITWPKPISELSTKDSQYPFLNDQFRGIKL